MKAKSCPAKIFVILLSIITIFSSFIVYAEPSNKEFCISTEEPLSIEEYKQILIKDGLSEKEAIEKITPHMQLRYTPEQVYRVTKTKTKYIANGFSLRCQVTVYVWRDVSTGKNLEIDRASAPYIQINGHSASSTFNGNIEAFTTTKKVTVDYNGDLEFTVDSSVSVSFGAIAFSNGSTTTYRYPVSGAFTWSLSEI